MNHSLLVCPLVGLIGLKEVEGPIGLLQLAVQGPIGEFKLTVELRLGVQLLLGRGLLELFQKGLVVHYHFLVCMLRLEGVL